MFCLQHNNFNFNFVARCLAYLDFLNFKVIEYYFQSNVVWYVIAAVTRECVTMK